MMPFIYFPKRVGWHWEVWHRYADNRPDPCNGSAQWRAAWGVSFWRKMTAMRIASDMQQAYNLGLGNTDDLPP